MSRKLPPHLSEEILAKYTPDYDNNVLKVKAKILNLRHIDNKETEVGDTHEIDFMPQVKLSRWFNDANMSIRISEAHDPSEPNILSEQDKLLYQKDTFEARFYLLPNDGLTGTPRATEFDLVFYGKPSSNTVEFTIASKNLHFFKQLPLTPKEVAAGVSRPAEIVHSYAVYHKKRNSGNYGNGKAFHIYRPIVYDAAGNMAHCELYIYPEQEGQFGTMIIVLPKEFMESALYPVVLDPTLGYTTLGGSNVGLKDQIETTVFSNNQRGILKSMSLGISSGSGTNRSIKMGIYRDDDNSLVDRTNAITNSVNGWNTANVIGGNQIYSSTDYKLGWKSNVTQMKVAFDSGGTAYTMTDAYANDFPDPYVPTATTARIWSIYATYSPIYTFTGDASLAVQETKYFYGDSILTRKVTGYFTGDANLKKTEKRIFYGDASILNILSTIFLGHSNLRKTVAQTYTGDASLSETQYGTFTGDANLKAIVDQAYLGDASLKKVIYGSFTGDSNLTRQRQNVFGSDSSLLRTLTGSYTGDSVLKHIVTGSFTGDANIKAILIFRGRANLKRIISEDFSADAYLISKYEETFTGDSNLKKDITEMVVSTGWYGATETGSYNEWATPEEALVDDDAYAQGHQIGAGSKRQSYHTFNFNIPDGAEILGVQVRYKHAETSTNPIDGKFELHVVAPVGQEGTKESDRFLLKTTSILGSETDNWGLALTPSQVNDDEFGVDVESFSYDTKNFMVYLYYIEMQITYKYQASFTGYSNLLRTEDRFFLADANLATVEQGYFFGEASLINVETRSFTGWANLLSVEIRTFLSESNLEKTEFRQFKSEARLLGKQEGQWRGNAYLYSSEMRFLYGPWTYGALYGGIIAGAGYYLDSFTGEANLYKSMDQQFLGDASLLRAMPGAYTGDANLEKYITEIFLGDAHFAHIVYGNFTGDSSLKSVEAGVFRGDAYITHPYFTGNANLAKEEYRYFLGDSALFKQYQQTFTGDADLLGIILQAFTGDANLYGTAEGQFAGDASLRSEEYGQFAGDALLQKQVIDAYTADANLVGTITGLFAGDSNFVKFETLPFTGDASLRQEGIEGSFTGDSSLRSIEAGQFTSDAFFTVEAVEVFAGSVILESRDQFAAFAGTCNCMNVAQAPGWGLSDMEGYSLDLGI